MLKQGDRVKAKPDTDAARKGSVYGTVIEDQTISELEVVRVKMDKKDEMIYFHPQNLEFVGVQDTGPVLR